MSQMLVSQKTEFERKLQETERSAASKEDNTIAKLHKHHAQEVEALRRAHIEDRSNLEDQLNTTRRVKDEEKELSLRAQECALDDAHQKEIAEQNMLYKRDLIDMQQNCNEEVATIRGRTLLELGASPRYMNSSLMPRYYTPDHERVMTSSERLLRSTSPLRRGGLF
uniref:Uncharacterized protein n=1 Tax=Polyblepharides amylifera TaxID=1486889 RepID=A0A7R9SVH0_9CHLO